MSSRTRVKVTSLTAKSVGIQLDECDKWLLDVCSWYKKRGGRTGVYLMGSGSAPFPYARAYIHRIIIQALPGQIVDHINGDGLDNRRVNLRIVSHTVNMQNRKGTHSNSASGFRGVFFEKDRNMWVAQARVSNKRYRRRFASLEEAVRHIEEWRLLNMPGYVPREVAAA